MRAQEKQVFVKYVQIKQKVVCGRIFVYGKHCHSCACVCRCVAINFQVIVYCKKNGSLIMHCWERRHQSKWPLSCFTHTMLQWKGIFTVTSDSAQITITFIDERYRGIRDAKENYNIYFSISSNLFPFKEMLNVHSSNPTIICKTRQLVYIHLHWIF